MAFWPKIELFITFRWLLMSQVAKCFGSILFDGDLILTQWKFKWNHQYDTTHSHQYWNWDLTNNLLKRKRERAMKLSSSSLSPFITVKRPLLSQIAKNFGFVRRFDFDTLKFRWNHQCDTTQSYQCWKWDLKTYEPKIFSQIRPCCCGPWFWVLQFPVRMWIFFLVCALLRLLGSVLLGWLVHSFVHSKPPGRKMVILIIFRPNLLTCHIHSMPYQISFLNRWMQQSNS